MDERKELPYTLKTIDAGLADVYLAGTDKRIGHVRKNKTLWESWLFQPEDLDESELSDPDLARGYDELIEVKRNKRARHAAAMVVFFAMDDECEKAV